MTIDAIVSATAAPGADYAATAGEAYRAALSVIESVEPRIAAATRKELADQRDSLKLIASENYASPAVLLTAGTWLSDKYAEGTIGHRFYAGCQNVDEVESIAAEHARELFGAPYAYVQPHSGIDANLVAFWAILGTRIEAPALTEVGVKNVNDLSEAEWERLRAKLGSQRLMGMSLDAGGHLTHGFRPNISGKMFHQRSYGTDPSTGLLDYDAVAAAAREFKPLILVAGYSAYPRRVNFATMREIADEVGATLMVDMAHFSGLVAGKVFTGDEDPVPHAHVVTTTTHKSLRGPRGGLVLATAEYSDAVDKGCPMVLGGPLSHVMAAKAVAFAEARAPSFRAYAQRVADNAKAFADGLMRRGATLVTPNRGEMQQAVGHWSSETDLAERAQGLRDQLELEALLVTRSEQGMTLFTANGSDHVDAQAHEVFDVSGAGDTVLATLAVMRAIGVDWPEAMRWANRAGGIVVGKLGTSIVTAGELA
jgi:glycine hydroxymethyltransferase